MFSGRFCRPWTNRRRAIAGALACALLSTAIFAAGTAPADDAAFDDMAAADAADVAEQVRSDERLVPLLVPLGNGLLAAVKKGE